MRRISRFSIADTVFLAIALLWAGMLIGVSFVATPIKFTASGLSLPVALEVGHVTFGLFSRIEWALASVLLLASVIGRTHSQTALAVVLAVLVALQAFWLLPVLDARVAAVIAGHPLPSTQHHTLYTIVEVAKLLLLIAAGIFGLRVTTRSRG